MAKVQLSARVDEALKTAVERHCKSRDIDVNHFIREALIDRLEALEDIEDIEDLTRLRHEPTRPLHEVLKELGVNFQP